MQWRSREGPRDPSQDATGKWLGVTFKFECLLMPPGTFQNSSQRWQVPQMLLSVVDGLPIDTVSEDGAILCACSLPRDRASQGKVHLG